jgi:hypothetical protein
MSKRKDALNRIRYEFSAYGKSTQIALRAMIENRISYEKFQEMAREGMKIFKSKNENV